MRTCFSGAVSTGFRVYYEACIEKTRPNFQPRWGGVHVDTATIWSAPTERSGDGALGPRACLATLKAVSRSACHRTPYIPHTRNWVVVARCTGWGERPREPSRI